MVQHMKKNIKIGKILLNKLDGRKPKKMKKNKRYKMNHSIKIFFLTLVCCAPYLLLCQSNIKKFYFVEYSIKKGTQSSIESYQFEYTRIYNKDSSFREKGLFTNDTLNKHATTDQFKIKNGCWYVKNKGKWKIFFNYGKSVATTIRINNYAFRVLWKKTAFLDDGKVIYRLELKPLGVSITGLGIYYFTPNEGVIAIDGHDYFTVRADKRYINIQ
jgi:hypothetical protein